MTDLKIRDTEWGALALDLARLACRTAALPEFGPAIADYAPETIETLRIAADLADRAEKARELAEDIHGFTAADFSAAHYQTPALDDIFAVHPRNGG